MHIASKVTGRIGSSEGWGTTPGVTTTWLIDGELGHAENGSVGIVDLESGVAIPAHQHPGAESVAYVLSGSGTFVAGGEEHEVSEGNILFAPSGSAHGARAGDGRLTLLVVLSVPGVADAGWEDPADGGPAARVLLGTERPEEEFDDPANGFVAVHARWLADESLVDAKAMTLGYSRFEVGRGVHELHRHPNAEEFYFLLSGEGVHLSEDGEETPAKAGEVGLMPANSWHGFRGTGDEEAGGVFGFLGANRFEAAGYEMPTADNQA